MDQEGSKLVFNEVEVKRGSPFVREKMDLAESDIALQALRHGTKNLQHEIAELSMDTLSTSKGLSRELTNELIIVSTTITQLEFLQTQESLAAEIQDFLNRRSE